MTAQREPRSERRGARGELLERLARLSGSATSKGGRSLEILTVALLAAGVLLVAAEFLDLFRVKIGPTVIDEQSGGEHHSFALLLIGAAVCAAAMAAHSTEAWPPAAGAAVLGGIVLLIALTGDLPDATRTDLVRGARIASADPAAGFWAELAGALLALSSGAALAFLLHRGTGKSTDRLARAGEALRPPPLRDASSLKDRGLE